jgi:hypothetical protein
MESLQQFLGDDMSFLSDRSEGQSTEQPFDIAPASWEIEGHSFAHGMEVSVKRPRAGSPRRCRPHAPLDETKMPQELSHFIDQLASGNFHPPPRPPHLSPMIINQARQHSAEESGYIYFRENPKGKRNTGQDKWLNSGGRSAARDYIMPVRDGNVTRAGVMKRYGRVNRMHGMSQLRFREFTFLNTTPDGEIQEDAGTVIFQVSVAVDQDSVSPFEESPDEPAKFETPPSPACDPDPLQPHGHRTAHSLAQPFLIQASLRLAPQISATNTGILQLDAPACQGVAQQAGRGPPNDTAFPQWHRPQDVAERPPFMTFSEQGVEVGSLQRSEVGGVTLTSASGDFAEWHELTQVQLAGGHYVIERRFQFKRAQRYIRSQLFLSTFG